MIMAIEINNNDNDAGREEERDIERKRDQNRRDVERKLRHEPMKTFEAKLSEKASKEMALHDSLEHGHLKNLKKEREEKQSLLEKIMGVAKNKESEKEKGVAEKIHRQSEHEFEDREGKRQIVHDENDLFETKKDDHTETKKTGEKTGEYSEEGHRRVAEKQDGKEGGASGGGGSDSGSGAMDSGVGGGAAGFAQDSGTGKNKDQTYEKLVLKARQGVAAIRDAAGSGAGSGSWKNARPFESKNLDDIVTEVQLGLNQKGEEEFTVTLTDHFFDGLKVQATRTDKGVVVKFICPNAQTRGTFVRYRPQVYAHFKAKNISIFRIDVV
jgi:hypothetical protein